MTLDSLIDNIRVADVRGTLRPIAELESNVGGVLPEDYRRFISRCSGGTTAEQIVEGQNDIVLDWILGLHEDGYLSIFEHYSELNGEIPKEVIPIIADPFGNYVCIDIGTPNNGRIYFFDHEAIDMPLKVICHSFSDFVSELKKIEKDA